MVRIMKLSRPERRISPHGAYKSSIIQRVENTQERKAKISRCLIEANKIFSEIKKSRLRTLIFCKLDDVELLPKNSHYFIPEIQEPEDLLRFKDECYNQLVFLDVFHYPKHIIKLLDSMGKAELYEFNDLFIKKEYREIINWPLVYFMNKTDKLRVLKWFYKKDRAFSPE